MLKNLLSDAKKIIGTAIILILIGALVFAKCTHDANKKLKTENSRLSNNSIQMLKRLNSIESATDQFVTKDELKQYYTDQTKLITELGLKAKNVERIIEIRTKTEYDSIKVPLKPSELNKDLYTFSLDTNCLYLDGHFKYEPEKESKLIFDNIDFDNETTFVDYWKRKKVKILFFKIGIGRKVPYQEVINPCSETKTQVRQIHLTKNNKRK